MEIPFPRPGEGGPFCGRPFPGLQDALCSLVHYFVLWPVFLGSTPEHPVLDSWCLEMLALATCCMPNTDPCIFSRVLCKGLYAPPSSCLSFRALLLPLPFILFFNSVSLCAPSPSCLSAFPSSLAPAWVVLETYPYMGSMSRITNDDIT